MAPLTPLVRPATFFAERDLDGLRILVVLGAVGIGLFVLYFAGGWILADRIDGTVSVDNPDRPSDTFCEGDLQVVDQSDCDQPRTIEKNVDSLLWRAWGKTAGTLLVGFPILWLLIGILLHVGAWLAGGENGIFPSFAVAAWGLVPSLVSGIVGILILYVTFDPITVTPANQGTVLETATESLRGVGSNGWILSLVASVWTAVIWRFGLEYRNGISDVEAWSVAGSVAAFLFVIGLG